MDASVLYSMRPLVQATSEFRSSCSMYKLKNVQKCTVNRTDVTTSTKTDVALQNELKVILRQEKLLSNVLQLQEEISTFRNRVNELKTSKTASVDVDALSSFAKVDIRDFVINADPQYPPYSLLWLRKLWNLPMNVSIHTHSSIPSLSPNLMVFNSLQTEIFNPAHINMTFIWKDVGPDTQLIVSPPKSKMIRGEVNILRFLDYILHSDEVIDLTRKNEVLDLAHRLGYASSRDETDVVIRLQKHLGNDKWFLQSRTPTVADVGVLSALTKLNKQSGVLPPTLSRWMSSCIEFLGKTACM